MKTVDYDALAASAPLNADAAKSFSMTGEADISYVVPETHDHWSAPPQTKPVPAGKEDRTGRRFGKFSVVGYLGRHRKMGSQWLVKCLCGAYERRRSKAIDNPENANDCCLRCRRLEQSKRNYQRQRFKDLHGYWPHEAPQKD